MQLLASQALVGSECQTMGHQVTLQFGLSWTGCLSDPPNHKTVHNIIPIYMRNGTIQNSLSMGGRRSSPRDVIGRSLWSVERTEVHGPSNRQTCTVCLPGHPQKRVVNVHSPHGRIRKSTSGCLLHEKRKMVELSIYTDSWAQANSVGWLAGQRLEKNKIEKLVTRDR